MNYNFNEIEAKWQKYWADNQTFKAKNPGSAPSEGLGEAYYVLDMFPYPSGAGLHVGHPLGYIASDIYARYKRHKGFNVLHPQGYDSFGLPAEQYAIQTGQHPAVTTENNIKRYREQLDKIGFSFDWSREVRTSNPEYYKWTQWIFIQLFESWYDHEQDKSRAISELEEIFASEGNTRIKAACDDDVEDFTAEEWNAFSSEEKQKILLKYRLTYLAETEVNWCPQLGTVLANDEIVNGVSERGGYPVVRKKMTQWSMRISAFAERLLQDLNKLDWTESLKESQRNWIGKSVGAMVEFPLAHPQPFPEGREQNEKVLPSGEDLGGASISVFTTRPDTIFGVTFMTLAPEHDLVKKITTPEQKEEVEAYIAASAKRSERERMVDVKSITGVFTGAYAEHPFTKEPVPIWIGDYVLAGYGTGAVMAVPCGDQRDYEFAKHFDLPIKNIFKNVDISEEAFSGKENTVIANSDFLSGLKYKEALQKAILELEKLGHGYGKTNYRLRDAVFSRQRYWGEPFPIYYKNGLPHPIPEHCLPLELPEVEKYLPTEEGEPPLGRAEKWFWNEDLEKVVSQEEFESSPLGGGGGLELNTMPGWAGSSWYLFRYMDPHNEEAFVSKEAQQYWENVDLYIGGSEHATGHLLYSRFWTKFLKDRGYLSVEEPFKKLINQGMILGQSAFVYRAHLQFSEHNLTESVNKNISEYFVTYTFVKKLKKLMDSIFDQNGISKEFQKNFIFGDGYSSHLVYTYLYLNNESYKQDADFKILQSELSVEDKELLEDNFNVYTSLKDDLLNQNTNAGLIVQNINFHPLHADVSLVNSSDELDIEGFKKWRPEFKDAEFILDNGEVYNSNSPSSGGGEGEAFSSPSGRPGGASYIVGREVEKMSKSKYNVINPDDICESYGADTLRMYEMFLGPLEQAKPWNTAGITGVHNFLKKLWKLYHSSPNPSEGGENSFSVSDEPASKDSLKTLHKTIKKVTEDIENFSFNTSVSTFMICVNELSAQNCNQREVLEPLAVLIAPYAPHIAEELWSKLDNSESVVTAEYPVYEEKYLVESTKNYPISFNGKMRFTMELPLDMSKDEIEKTVLGDDRTKSYLSDEPPKKIIVVPGKIVNIVI